ncbi:hexose transporter [Thozetella sp. PMI_491]|nr:hexose transporter [Thozetella sp. PMI_491]
MRGTAMESTANPVETEVQRLIRLDTTPWYKKPNLRTLYFLLIPVCLGVEMTTGYDGSVLNGLQAVSSWQTYFGNPSGLTLGILSASYNLGGLITLPIIPTFNDRFGRKHSITLGSAILATGVALQAAAINYGMFLAARLIAGMGIAFAVSGASQLLAELTHPRERAVITGLFNASWSVGSILAAGITLGTYNMGNDWAWRIPTILQIAPSALQLTFVWFVPDSPRWLISRDLTEEAFEILVKYHAEGDRDSPFVHAEFQEISNQIRLEVENSRRHWIELLQTPGNRKRTLIATCVGIFTQWSGNGLISCGPSCPEFSGYYLSRVLNTIGITDKRTQNVLNLSLSCFQLCVGVSASFLTRILKRRTQYLTAFCGMILTFSIWTGCSAYYSTSSNHDAATAVVAFIFIYYMSYHIMQPLTYIYVTEVFPFIYRAKGVALLQFFTRGTTAFNSFVNPIGMDSLGWKFLLVYLVWLCVETTIIYFLYPETQGRTLEELAQLFDDDVLTAEPKLAGEDEEGQPGSVTRKAWPI